MTTIEAEAALQKGWVRSLWRVASAVWITALVSCGGGSNCVECYLEDIAFYDGTWLVATPGSMTVNPGDGASALVNVGFNKDGAWRRTAKRSYQGVSIVPPTPGVTLTPTTDACAPPEGMSISSPFCETLRLDVSADAIAAGVHSVTLSAIWTDTTHVQPHPERTLERVETFRVSLTASPTPPPPAAPDFQLAVGTPTGGVYATRATLPVSITRVGGFGEAVTVFTFDAMGSGIAGTFVADPASPDRRNLQLEIPARYAAGGLVDLKVTATAAGGLAKVVNVSQFIEPLFRINVEPASATLTSLSPLQVDVSVEPGNAFRTTSLGVVELSISPSTPPPPGVSTMFLDDATPVAPVLPVVKVWRKLQLVTNGVLGRMGPLTIRGTARGVPADADGVVPFIETTLDLTVVEGQFWQFVGNNLTYGTTGAEAIGIAMQSDNRPAVAWLTGPPKRVYLRRFDGTTFAPSPPLVNGSLGPYAPGLEGSNGIEEASLAMSPTDVAQVAFTYERGAYLALGSTAAGAAWTIGAPVPVGDPGNDATARARSPRIATGPGDAVVVSYIRAADAAATSGELHVLRTFGSGVLHPLPSPLPSGALNGSSSALRNATALALRADGNPWVAWIEQPPASAARLWLRAFDGVAWGSAIEVPTPGTPVGPSVQLLVESSGTVVVSWLEGNPAQLKLMRYDPSSLAWTRLDNSGNGRGSLNVTADTPALDVHLARYPDGRLLVTWTEGGADPRVWIRRLDADGGWRLVGTTVSQADRWSKTPRIVSDANNRLYVTWAQYAAGQNPGTALPYVEIEVAQWIFP